MLFLNDFYPIIEWQNNLAYSFKKAKSHTSLQNISETWFIAIFQQIMSLVHLQLQFLISLYLVWKHNVKDILDAACHLRFPKCLYSLSCRNSLMVKIHLIAVIHFFR